MLELAVLAAGFTDVLVMVAGGVPCRLRSSAMSGGGCESTRISPARSRFANADLMWSSSTISLGATDAATGLHTQHHASTRMNVER
jgi:hypothetical protein